MPTYTDNFVRADASPLSGNWAAPVFGQGLQIISNLVTPQVSNGTVCWEISTATTWPNDQNSSVTISTCSGAALAGAIVRADISTETFYDAVADPGANLLVLAKFVSGSGSVLATTAYTFTPSDILNLIVAGTTITVQINGVTQITQLDSGIASGSPGMLQQESVAGTSEISFWSSTITTPPAGTPSQVGAFLVGF